MKQLHDKIKELQLRIGHAPIAYSSFRFESRAKVDDNTRLIKAYFAVWGVPDNIGTVCVRGCFSKSLQERGPGTQAKQKILVLYMHDQRDPLCVPTILQEDDYGLYGEFTPDDGVPSGDRTVTQVRSGTINQFSFGFNYVWDKMEYDDQRKVVLMKECDLYEVSPVSIGSNKETFAVRSITNPEQEVEFLREETEDFIKACPRGRQLELRQLIERHISLAKSEPLEELRRALGKDKPIEDGLSVMYKSILNEIKK